MEISVRFLCHNSPPDLAPTPLTIMSKKRESSTSVCRRHRASGALKKMHRARLCELYCSIAEHAGLRLVAAPRARYGATPEEDAVYAEGVARREAAMKSLEHEPWAAYNHEVQHVSNVCGIVQHQETSLSALEHVQAAIELL